MSDQLQMTDGMHIIVEALKQNNIDTIYGVVGIPVTDMARHAQAEGIRYIGFRHEQSAGYAAAASGFLTQNRGSAWQFLRQDSSMVWPHWPTQR